MHGFQKLSNVPVELQKPTSARHFPKLPVSSQDFRTHQSLDLWPLLGVQQPELHMTEAKFFPSQPAPLPFSLAAYIRNLRIT